MKTGLTATAELPVTREGRLPSLPPKHDALPQRVAARLTGSPLFWTVFMALVFGLPLIRSVRRQLPQAPPVLGTLPAFRFIDQAGKPFGNAEAQGRLLIVEFVADGSAAVSPLTDLQRRVRNTANAVHLVSFVQMTEGDPATFAGRLDGMARSSHAGDWRWTFAGGDTRALEGALVKALGTPTLDGKLLLVDGQGRLRRLVSNIPEQIDLLMRDIGLIANFDRQG